MSIKRLNFTLQVMFYFDNQDSKVCVSSDLLFTQNTQFKTKATGTGLFCIYKDNYSSRNYYNDIRSASSAAEFSDLKSQASKSTFADQGLTQPKPSSSTSYKAGDPILLVFENGAKGFLSLPKPLFSKECDDENPAGYLVDGSSECTRTVIDLASQCSSLPFLAAKSFYKGFKVAKNPSVYFGSTNNATITVNIAVNGSNVTQPLTTWLLNTSLLLDINVTQPIMCKTDLGVSTSCGFNDPPNPLYDAVKKMCNNVVYEEGTDSFSRSGNPGYIVGKPLVAGTLTSDSSTKTEYILLNIDPSSWLTIAAPSSDGSCNNSTDRIPVAFGMGIRTGCTIRLSLSTSSSSCQVLQDTALNVLLAGVPTHVATFGNSDVNKPSDWVKILNNRPTQTVGGGNGACTNMIMGLHIEVLYSNFGFLANPQPKVSKQQQQQPKPFPRARGFLKSCFVFQCVGPYCQLGNKSLQQSFEVVTSVQFIDVSTKPETLLKPTPTFEAKAPSDFFYPFL
ncbi:hypothetical protein QZH41_012846 [Actinostola sp. cb2023]|nr:hypothetical protein QZH41_012846 [Actinostola sp. cb2023]